MTKHAQIDLSAYYVWTLPIPICDQVRMKLLATGIQKTSACNSTFSVSSMLGEGVL